MVMCNGLFKNKLIVFKFFSVLVSTVANVEDTSHINKSLLESLIIFFGSETKKFKNNCPIIV